VNGHEILDDGQTSLFLIKYGEIQLKGDNRSVFEKKLLMMIRKTCAGIPVRVTFKPGRIYLSSDSSNEDAITHALSCVFGIVGFCKATRCGKNMEEISHHALALSKEFVAEGKGTAFKVEARRTDKSFPLTSYEIACKLGDHLLENLGSLNVNVRQPDWVLSVEIRERAFLYGPTKPGLRGLPVGCNGKSLLLLSGGIDSPVAGLAMASRGLLVHAVYFHTPPFTSEQAKDKVKKLSEIMRRYIPGHRLYCVNFSPIQTRLAERAPVKAVTLMARSHMMKIADLLARELCAKSLITGECLGQVASQTPESLHVTGSFAKLPVWRPLIGMDKEDIIKRARAFGTFDISTLPYDDCCTIFAPEHPLIRPDYDEMRAEFAKLETDDLIVEALNGTEEL